MTYEEYRNKDNKKSKNKFISTMINKLFTVIIFTMLVVIISNYSPSFRNFVINKVLNNTMDFSKYNKFLTKVTNVFDNNETVSVSKIIDEKTEKYKDGIKYIIGDGQSVYLKDSGIVVYIGEKEGYGNTIVIQQSNGYYAWYGNINEKVKLYDYVESGSIIGTASKEYYYVLLKENES